MGDAERDDHWERLARLLRHPLRQLVLFKYSQGVTSPRAIAAAVGSPLNTVSYHTKVLCDQGFIELVRTEARRGATEHFYRATFESLIGDAAWQGLPVGLRRALVRHMIDAAMRDAADAIPAGGMDAATTHMSRTYLDLDGHARTELACLLRDTFEQAAEIAKASGLRGSTEVKPHELVIMSFELQSRP
jgi:hypothetical protein